MEQKHKYQQFKGQPRLPKFVVPKRYDIKLKPDLTACKFAGNVNIFVDVVADTKFIVLNAAELSVDSNSARFRSQDGSKVLEAKEVELFEEDEILVVEFTESLPAGAGSLFIAFDGTLNDKMKGFFRRLVAQELFKPTEGGVLVDVSCGSGLFSQKFAKSWTYSGVIALDFSENMLRQCYDFIKKDDTILNFNLALVRADVSRLPFTSGSVDAVHAGAALHCWPSPSNARVLRDYNYLTAEEIEDLCSSCGLINYTSKIQQSFIMFSAQKP